METKTRTSSYAAMIREDCAAIGCLGYNVRWVEGWMRLEQSTLDGLSAKRFRHEVKIACECIDCSTAAQSEQLATSYGL